MPGPGPVVKARTVDELCGMRLDIGVYALIGAGDNRETFFDIGVDAAVAACPIGMFAKQADASGDEDFHGECPCTMDCGKFSRESEGCQPVSAYAPLFTPFHSLFTPPWLRFLILF